jgi:hypothetical protein
MKQTAVEWLQKQLKDVKYNPLEKNGYSIAEERLFNQAKEMEKEQIIDAFGVGCQVESTRLIGYQGMAKQYYNETFNKDKQ